MKAFEIGLLLKPLVFLFVFGFVTLPFRIAVEKWMPEGKLKRILLFRLDGKGSSDGKSVTKQ